MSTMRDIFGKVLEVIEALNAQGVDYVVFGGVAVNLHGLVRATEDLGLFIRPDPENIERLKVALRSVWDDPHIDEISSEDLCGDYPVVRYGPPDGEIYIDMLTRLGEFVTFEKLSWSEIEVEGTRARVATPRTLYELKRNTVRPIDAMDATILEQRFDLDEEE